MPTYSFFTGALLWRLVVVEDPSFPALRRLDEAGAPSCATGPFANAFPPVPAPGRLITARSRESCLCAPASHQMPDNTYVRVQAEVDHSVGEPAHVQQYEIEAGAATYPSSGVI